LGGTHLWGGSSIVEPPLGAAVLTAVLLATSLPGSAAAATRTLDPNTQFFNPVIGDAPLKQINALIADGRRHEAEVLRKMEEQPHAVWLTKGTPKEVRFKVEQVVLKARAKGQVPILVAYNIPGRDCAGLSAGGALTTPEYKAWIDAFAAGIGSNPALVMLEPDGLGLLPSNCGGPNPAYPFTDTERYEELYFAVDRLAQQPRRWSTWTAPIHTGLASATSHCAW
jgi:endoglucanase